MRKRQVRKIWLVLIPKGNDLFEDVILAGEAALREEDKSRVYGRYRSEQAAYKAALPLMRRSVLEALGYSAP